MDEFMLLVRNGMNHQNNWAEERHHQFLKKCESYIGDLKKGGHLKIAQPLVSVGKMLSRQDGRWNEALFQEHQEVIVGYYHIYANDLEHAIALAKGNPEFEFSDTARIEVRPIKTKEISTGFEYPEGGGDSRG